MVQIGYERAARSCCVSAYLPKFRYSPLPRNIPGARSGLGPCARAVARLHASCRSRFCSGRSEPLTFSERFAPVICVKYRLPSRPVPRGRVIRFLAGAAQTEDLHSLSSSITADVEKPTPLR
jgi:hypothetical protein